MNKYDLYFNWLLDQVMYDDMLASGRNYYELLATMHDTAFIWHIEKDANRAEDGRFLRTKFGLDQSDSPCSFLEMLIALSIRMNDEVFEVDPLAKPARWFWVMVENCGLDILTDENFDGGTYDEIVGKVLDRRYSRTGIGGLFPLRHSKKDQREVEIWYQMQAYVIENFDY